MEYTVLVVLAILIILAIWTLYKSSQVEGLTVAETKAKPAEKAAKKAAKNAAKKAAKKAKAAGTPWSSSITSRERTRPLRSGRSTRTG